MIVKTGSTDVTTYFALRKVTDGTELTGAVMEIADEYARRRLVSVLEGGYDLAGLASAVGAHVKRLTAGGSWPGWGEEC